jgi:hypothetical protein
MKGIIKLKFIKIAGNPASIYDGNKAVKTSASKVVGKYSDGIKGYLKRHSIDAEVTFTIEDGE